MNEGLMKRVNEIHVNNMLFNCPICGSNAMIICDADYETATITCCDGGRTGDGCVYCGAQLAPAVDCGGLNIQLLRWNRRLCQ